MKKVEIKFDKNNLKKYARYLVRYRKLFFVMFFIALFIFTFNVIYKNAYYNMEHINYKEARNFEGDETRKNVMFEEIIENVNFRERVMRDARNKEYKNIFNFNDMENSGENNNSEGDDENDNPTLPTESYILPAH